MMSGSENVSSPARELSVSFGYQCNTNSSSCPITIGKEPDFASGATIHSSSMKMRSGSFSCLSGAALSANATLANTNICNGLIGDEILPSLDSPTSFRRMASSSSLPKLDLLSSSSTSNSSMTTSGGSLTMESDYLESERNSFKYMSAPTRSESSSFLDAMDSQMAGGAAGEDRVQAVCSEENGWLFCGIYDGFNGRDAADFLAVTLYERIGFHLNLLEWHAQKEFRSLMTPLDDGTFTIDHKSKLEMNEVDTSHSLDKELARENFRHGVLDGLKYALAHAESDFMNMVEQEMEDRPDLVSVGSCVLVALLHENDIYILNLGDSRAVLAKHDIQGNDVVNAIQLTETHSVENKLECMKILADHPDDPSPIFNGRVKGKLKLSRAFGVGYLKKKEMNDALMGILRVQNLCSPPYVYTHPFTTSHRVSENDEFIVLGSDGLFDFFSNEEVVNYVYLFIKHNPVGDPAKYLIEQLIHRAADNAGFSTSQELMRVPVGRRRKYHDDVTVIVIILGNTQRTSTASTSL